MIVAAASAWMGTGIVQRHFLGGDCTMSIEGYRLIRQAEKVQC